jgi:hypothetical protein
MLSSKKIDKVCEDLILQLLHHPSNRVKIEAIHVVAGRNLSSALDSLEKLFITDTDESVGSKPLKHIAGSVQKKKICCHTCIIQMKPSAMRH